MMGWKNRGMGIVVIPIIRRWTPLIIVVKKMILNSNVITTLI